MLKVVFIVGRRPRISLFEWMIGMAVRKANYTPTIRGQWWCPKWSKSD
jgi:hypothetical protein